MKQTALIEKHREAKAKLVDFHGWKLPIHYGSQLDEHHAVRQSAGMFDVSHMTVVDLLGAGVRTFLRHLLANDIDQLSRAGQALYTCMLNQHGGILDDLIVYFRAPDNYRLILNAATRDRDLEWLKEQSSGFAVGLQERNELAMLAVQGPEAIKACLSVFDESLMDPASTLQPFECLEWQDWFVARTGYTGEDGFEIVLPESQICKLWDKLLTEGVRPCGLGARDTLRLEAGMMLYGQDMNDSTTPLESGLSWTVKSSEEDRDFIGRGALIAQKQHGVKSKMVGLILDDKGVMRQGYAVYSGEQEIGEITSGGFSPTLEKSIAFARVDKSIGEHCDVLIRGKKVKAKVTKPRFVRQGKPINS